MLLILHENYYHDNVWLVKIGLAGNVTNSPCETGLRTNPMHGILWVHPVRIPEGYASERKRDGVALLYLPPTLFSVVLHLRLAAVGRPGSSVRILVQYEGVGTLGNPNSQPRHDLALAHARTHQRNPLLTVLSFSLFLFSSDSTQSVSDAYTHCYS